MATPNWDSVLTQAIAAAQGTLKNAWSTVGPSAQHNIQLLVDTAAYIAANQSGLTDADKNLLINNQKLAMQNVLLGYEAIGIALAEQAVAAAWGVVSNALTVALSAV